MAGTIGLSLTQRFDAVTAEPLNGGKLYFIQAGTTSTPQNAFQDSALTIPWPNPMTLDAGGNIPQLFFADGQIKVRLTNAAGVEQIVADNILVVGASSGGGGGGTVDPTTILATGDVKYRYGTGVLTGFVRANARTIGSSTSGATERANADSQALFEYLWNTDSTLTVSTGRGASANADWVANKTIALPDFRGRLLVGPDGMGNSLAGRIGSGAGSFGVNNDTLGKAGGAEVHGLTVAQLPAFTPVVNVTVPATNFGVPVPVRNNASIGGVTDATKVALGNDANANAGALNVTATFPSTAASVSVAQIGSGAVHDTMSPAIIVTTYIKL